MTRGQYARSKTMKSVQTYLDMYPELFGALNRTAARKRLDAAAKQLDSAAVQQLKEHRLALGETNQQRSVERELKQGHMTPVAKFARASLADAPHLRALTPSTGNKEGRRLAQIARSMRTAAEPLAKHFREAQFPMDFLVQLGTLADWLVAAMDRRDEHIMARAGATKAIAVSLAEGRAAIATLDAVVTRLIAGNGGMMAAWRAAKRVQLKPGPVRKSARARRRARAA